MALIRGLVTLGPLLLQFRQPVLPGERTGLDRSSGLVYHVCPQLVSLSLSLTVLS